MGENQMGEKPDLYTGVLEGFSRQAGINLGLFNRIVFYTVRFKNYFSICLGTCSADAKSFFIVSTVSLRVFFSF